MGPTTKVVSIAQLFPEGVRGHKDLTVLDEEHAIARSKLSHNDVSLQEYLIAQVKQDGVDEAGVTVLEHWRALQHAGAQDIQNFLQQLRGR